MSNAENIQFYGSITNRLDSHRCYTKETEPTVGMDATYYAWSDRYPLTVVEVSKNWNNKNYDIVVCQQDKATPDKDKGYDYFGNQVYKYERNLDGAKYYLKSFIYKHPQAGETKIYKSVRWNDQSKRWNVLGKSNIGFGIKEKYCDPSF